MHRPIALFLLAALAGCDGAGCDAAGGNAAFRASGEVIAFGGGDGGAGNACATCHGLSGEGDGRLTPRLAGLDPGYLRRQLDDYASGRREHPAMRAIVRRLSGNDRALVAGYYAALQAPTERLSQTSSLFQSRCAQCHGVNGEGVGPGNPPLAGQPPAYIAAQLSAWRAGKRRGDPASGMLAISQELTPGEIDFLAGHAAVLPPAGHPPPVPAASR